MANHVANVAAPWLQRQVPALTATLVLPALTVAYRSDGPMRSARTDPAASQSERRAVATQVRVYLGCRRTLARGSASTLSPGLVPPARAAFGVVRGLFRGIG